MHRQIFESFSPLPKSGDTGIDHNADEEEEEDEELDEVEDSGEEDPSTPTESGNICQQIKRFINAQFFLLAVVAAVGIALAAPSVGKTGGILHSEYTISYGATICIFLLTGLSLRTAELAKAFLSVGFNCYTQCFSFLAIPAMTYPVVKLLEGSFISPDLLDGLLITVRPASFLFFLAVWFSLYTVYLV